MTLIDEQKLRKRKEPTVHLGFRIQKSVADRLESLGKPGTIAAQVATEFTIVKELQSKAPSKIVNGQKGSVVYITNLGADLHHITIKKGPDVLIAELSSQEIADCVVNLVEVLNSKNYKP